MHTDSEFVLEPGERIMLTVRRHWLMFALELVPFFIAVLVPLALPSALSLLASALPPGTILAALPLSGAWMRYGLGLWWLFIWTVAFATFTRSYLDLWIITTTRIVNVKQVGLFHRKVESFLLARVQDVSTEVSGFLATVIGIGSVRIETAGGESKSFRMWGLPRPEDIRDLVIRMIADLDARGMRPNP